MATAPATAETLRLATYKAELTRRGPGLLLKDILSGDDPQVAAAVEVIVALDADVLLLTGIDYDHGHAALAALVDRLAAAGAAYPHVFAARPNSGQPTGFDIYGNGRLGEARDAQGYGRFAGEGAMALLSRLPVDADAAQDFSDFLWADLPQALTPDTAEPLRRIQRLSSTGHWQVPVALPGGRRLDLLAYSATPPVFDGPEDRNGRRNHDETAFWQRLIDGALPFPAPAGPFVILGNANLDPVRGDGRPAALLALMGDARLQDPRPVSDGLDDATAVYADGPGPLRVDYVLPSAGLRVVAAGVLAAAPGDLLAGSLAAASRHRPVWVDIDPGP